ncbi:MAG: ORC1-type DNA replication protein [Methanomassiliicoccales archaeon]|nr:MAG: ORC1-type DNA replication protein [Methanomassiliicoccales archaeon]
MEETVFQTYLKSDTLFKKNRDILRPSYIPENLPHRDYQIDQLASILATALRGDRPSNVLIFGKTGTGKTAVVKFLGNEIKKSTGDMENIQYIYINCEVVDTQYGILANIGNRFIKDWEEHIPFTGWPTEKVYNRLKEKMDLEPRVTVIILDEIDKLVYKSGDDVLYHLSKINDDLKQAKVSIIGISNDLKFTEFLDPRIKSRLGEEKMVFPPYNAQQLRDILMQRAELAFREGVVEPSVIAICAALAAQEHGDARRALELLRVAGELAERNKEKMVTETYVYKAKNKIELDCVAEVIRTLPTQSKLLLFGMILNQESGTEKLNTGDVYSTYKELCKKIDVSVLTQRRITDLLSELDMLGIIHARVISKGRYGRTREIQLSVPIVEARKVLEEDEIIKELYGHKIKIQATLDFTQRT